MLNVPYVLQCVWPIVDETNTRSQLIAEATPLLDDMADEANAVIVGPPVWTIADAATVPGWEDYPGSVLIAQTPAEPAPARQRSAPSRDIDQVAVERAIRGDRSVTLGPRRTRRRRARRRRATPFQR